VVLVCFLVALIDGYDTLMLSFLAPLISKEWSMLPGSFGKVFAAGFAGTAVGAIAVGMAADRFGRKRMLALALAVAGTFTALCAGASTPSELMFWRFLAGIGLGGAIPAVSALTAEHARPDRRTETVSRMFLGFPIGAIAGGAITAALMQAVGWRAIFVAGGALALVLLPFALAIVTETAGRPAAAGSQPARAKRPIAELVAEGRMLGTVLVCAAVFMILLVTYFLISWTPSVLALSGMSPQRAALAAVVLNVGGVIGCLGTSFAITGRNPFLLVGAALGAGALLIPVLGLHIVDSEVAAFALVFMIGLTVVGGQMNIPALCVYYYPPAVRATGVGLSMAFGRIGSIVGPLVGGFLVAAKLPWSELFLLVGIPALIAAAALGCIAWTSRR
jgi:AAHS family 4-hydroxybenzoate transporter-like MFS transporter